MSREIRYINTDKTAAVEELLHAKLDKLSEKYSWITNAAVFIKEEKRPEEKNHECEIKLSVPGPQIFASNNDTTISKAIHNVIGELSVQLERKKDKMQEKR
jgi:putative sigma-54 modulation protein